MTRSCYQEQELKKERTEHGNDFMWEWIPVADDISIPSCIGRVHLNGIVGIKEIVEIEKVEDGGCKLFFRVWLHRKKIYGTELKVVS